METKIKTEYDIILKDEIYDEIFTLMQNIKELNDNKEIAAFLTGDWFFNKETNIVKILLDNFIIPTQVVSTAEVEIKEEGMMDVLKQIGIDNGNRIRAHWHIHPFCTEDTSWSGTDEAKIKDFMDPDKGREIFIFLLSSQNKIKGRVVINWKTIHPITKEQQIITKSIDNLEVHREKIIENVYMDKLKDQIKEKVSSIISYPYGYNKKVNNSGYKGYQGYDGYGVTNIDDEEEERDVHYENYEDYYDSYNNDDKFKVDCDKKKFMVIIDFDKDFFDYVIKSNDTKVELKTPDTQMILKSGKIRIGFNTSNKKNMENIMETFEANLYEVQNFYYHLPKKIH